MACWHSAKTFRWKSRKCNPYQFSVHRCHWLWCHREVVRIVFRPGGVVGLVSCGTKFKLVTETCKFSGKESFEPAFCSGCSETVWNSCWTKCRYHFCQPANHSWRFWCEWSFQPQFPLLVEFRNKRSAQQQRPFSYFTREWCSTTSNIHLKFGVCLGNRRLFHSSTFLSHSSLILKRFSPKPKN